MGKPQPTGLVFGDHQFLDPSQSGPMSRLRAPKRQIRGAPPPTYLDGLARESTPQSPSAKELFKGKFCGHGEPTMTIFDIVIDEQEELEIGVCADDDRESNLVAVLARPVGGGTWSVLFRRVWEMELAMLVGRTQEPPPARELALLHPDLARGRVSIGFEYPCDATSRDDASWLTIDMLMEGERKPACLVDAEMA